MRTLAFSDLHGQRNLWEQIKTFLRPDDKVYFLGDAIDRGEDGWAILKELLADPRITYIKGNHEDMMVNALRTFPRINSWSEDMTIWGWNGNAPTMEAILNDDEATVLQTLNTVKALPSSAVYINAEGREIHLCHAGFTPGARPANEYDFIWDRDHLYTAVPEEYADGSIVVVHGHTPVPLLLNDLDERISTATWLNNIALAEHYSYQEKNGIAIYADGVKIDIDCGCFFTGQISMLNLDTWETIQFSEGE